MHGLLLAAAAGGGSQVSFIEAFKHSPYFIALNMVVSAIVLAVVAERTYFQLTRYKINANEFFLNVKKLVTGGNIERAIHICDAGDYPVLQLVKAGLTHANKGEGEIDAALSEKLSEIKPKVEARLPALWSLANIATLIGLLGTVSGLIRTFSAVSAPGLTPADKQSLLSLGIAEAMFNTAGGLGIAVFCMITHLILQSRAKGIVHELESILERTFNMLVITNKQGY